MPVNDVAFHNLQECVFDARLRFHLKILDVNLDSISLSVVVHS